jgi:hypothetical protein
MHVIGRAVFEDGRPIPEFKVQVVGFDGNINLFAGLPSLGFENARNGRYAVLTKDTFKHEKPVKALVVGVTAEAKLKYKGHEYIYKLHPVDGKIDGSDSKAFRGESGKGVVRDFVMKMTGVRPGWEENATGETNYKGAMYGGSLSIDCTQSTSQYPAVEDATSLTKLFPPESSIELRLEPTGPLLDGARGGTVIRKFPLGTTYGNWREHFLRSIPMGEYTATARLTAPGGQAHALRLKLKTNDAPQAVVTVLWVPENTYLWPMNLYLVR